jgi:hypothetical protein
MLARRGNQERSSMGRAAGLATIGAIAGLLLLLSGSPDAAAKGSAAPDAGPASAKSSKSRKTPTLPQDDADAPPKPAVDAKADDVPEYDPRLQTLRESLLRVKELKDQRQPPLMAGEVWEMRALVKKLEQDSLAGHQSVAARALLGEAEDLCTQAGADEFLDRFRDSPELAKLEMKRRAIVKQISQLESGDASDREHADNLRGKLIELVHELRKQGFPAPEP